MTKHEGLEIIIAGVNEYLTTNKIVTPNQLWQVIEQTVKEVSKS